MLMGEFATAVKYKLPIKVIVIKNNMLGQIKWEQMVFLGNPEYGCELQPIDFAAFARGLRRRRASRSSEPGRLRQHRGRRRWRMPGPVLIEAVVDPYEPPMPPKIDAEQALHFAEVAGARRAEPRQDRADGPLRQGPRTDLEPAWRPSPAGRERGSITASSRRQ